MPPFISPAAPTPEIARPMMKAMEFGAEPVGPGSVGAPPARQQDVRCAGAGQPARDLPAQGSGAAGDEHGAGRAPLAAPGGRSERTPDEPADEHAGLADGGVADLASHTKDHAEQGGADG